VIVAGGIAWLIVARRRRPADAAATPPEADGPKPTDQ
jgi:hypothetical protein